MSDLLSIPVAFRPGTRLPGGIIDDPAAVNRVIATARTLDGDLLAADIVAAASSPSSPIHAAFEWDDQVAGERYREGQAFYLAGSLIDTKTGERVYVSRYKETNNPDDIGRIRINVRPLPLPATPAAPLTYTVRMQSTEPAPMPGTEEVTAPVTEAAAPVVVDHTPEGERALVVFRRWVDAHKHEPDVLRAALRVLYDAI